MKGEWREKVKNEVVTVTDEDVALVTSLITGIPLFRLARSDSERLMGMEDDLKKCIVGQDDAVSAVARAIRRARAGIKDPQRPIGSFMFLGPTGVGKTELARVLSQYLFENDHSLVRIDMSEYMEKFNVSRLVGAPPGYVGYEEGGQLTEKVRRKPYSVVLLDEIEKAHPDVFNMLLQVLDSGHLTDSLGRMVDFKNTILIMTSNLGARELDLGKNLGFHSTQIEDDYRTMEKKVMSALKKKFNPEFLNRVDEIVVFRALEREAIIDIIDIMVNDVRKRLMDRNIDLRITDGAKAFLADEGYSEMFGARPLKRAIQKYLENSMAEDLLEGKFNDDSVIEVDVGDKELTFTELSSTSREAKKS